MRPRPRPRKTSIRRDGSAFDEEASMRPRPRPRKTSHRASHHGQRARSFNEAAAAAAENRLSSIEVLDRLDRLQ